MTDTPTAQPNARDREVSVMLGMICATVGYGDDFIAMLATYRAEIEAAARADERAKIAGWLEQYPTPMDDLDMALRIRQICAIIRSGNFTDAIESGEIEAAARADERAKRDAEIVLLKQNNSVIFGFCVSLEEYLRTGCQNGSDQQLRKLLQQIVTTQEIDRG